MLKDHLIIFFPLVDWNGPWQRYQHLALHFSKSNHVVYMNSPVAITYFMTSPLDLLKKWVTFLRGKRKIGPNLTCYFPPPCLPFERLSIWVNLVNQYILFLYIKFFVKPERNVILWINDPYKYLMIRLLRPKMAIYDCPDAIVFKKNGWKQKIYDRLKERVLKESTVSFFTSKALLKGGKKSSDHCYYVPNGVSFETFLRKKYEKTRIIKKCSEKIIGVVGTVDERIDLDLIVYVLENIRESIVFLVGPIRMKMGDLAHHPRVVLTGQRAYEEMPSFINHFDVGLIPYRINEVTKAIYPVKLHEYLILGKPVVSTDLPEVRQFSDLVWIAGSRERFVWCIRKALEDSNAIRKAKRIEVAKRNSWENRLDQIEKIIGKYY